MPLQRSSQYRPVLGPEVRDEHDAVGIPYGNQIALDRSSCSLERVGKSLRHIETGGEVLDGEARLSHVGPKPECARRILAQISQRFEAGA